MSQDVLATILASSNQDGLDAKLDIKWKTFHGIYGR